ncbi:hypothetical protein NXT48_003884, partial [Acinetobacter baumannii]
MINLLELLYLGDFYSLVFIFFLMLMLASLIFFALKKRPIFYNSFSLSFFLTLIAWLSINAAPLPFALQENIKTLLIQQAKAGVGSNGLVNRILVPCMYPNKGYIRGFDYHYALDSYKTDMQKHLDKTEAFKVQPKSVLNIDTSLELCKF